jgi:hypothetical protein
MNSTLRTILAMGLALGLGGCMTGGTTGGGADVDGDGKADIWGESQAASHRDAVLQCERNMQAALENASSTVAMVQTQATYQQCLFAINNTARETIEQNLADIESDQYGTSLQTFADYRWAAETLCGVAVDWSDGADGTMSQIVRAGCLAEGERALADLIDAFVYFGDQQTQAQIAEDRAAFATCYEAQDAALETAVANNEMIQAMHASADCIERQIDGRVADLAAATVATFPGRDLATVQAAIREAVWRMFDLGGAMCSLVAAASDSGGGTMANLYQADCRSDADELLFRFAGVGANAAAAEPDAIEAHLEQGQAPQVDPGVGVFALYAPGVAPNVVHFTTLAELYAGVPGAEQAFGFGTCDVQEGTVAFDCESEFAAQGCFMSAPDGAAPITRTYQMLAEYDFYTATAEELAAAAAAEAYIDAYVVVTAARMALYYGTVDGRVVLLAVDLSSFSCDA